MAIEKFDVVVAQVHLGMVARVENRAALAFFLKVLQATKRNKRYRNVLLICTIHLLPFFPLLFFQKLFEHLDHQIYGIDDSKLQFVEVKMQQFSCTNASASIGPPPALLML